MSAVLDHPDIEKLQLEVDGIPVRETIRDFFVNSPKDVDGKPLYGEPDGISKAGCLALALKSNEVGGKGKGHIVWNDWRSYFPVVVHQFSVVNNVDFSHEDLSCLKNFSRFKFGSNANFQGAHSRAFANFHCAEFGNNANFVGTYWGYQSDFAATRWGQSASFRGAHWGSQANFTGAQFGAHADFYATTWKAGTSDDQRLECASQFQGSQFGDFAKFIGSQWQENSVHFTARNWEELRSLYRDDAEFDEAKQWAAQHGLDPNKFGYIDFSGARFTGEAVFTNRKFSRGFSFGLLESDQRERAARCESGRPAFFKDEKGVERLKWEPDSDQSMHVSFGNPPIFHGCELHQDTSFEGAQFPPASGSEEAARAYRTLKLAFSKQQAIREEQRFFRLEMEEETLRETGLRRWLFQAYKTFSDYGFSITRPLKYGCLSVLMLTAVYGLLSWLGQCGFSMQTCRFAPQWLEFSLLQTLPLPGLDKLSEAASKVFWPAGAWWSLALSVLVIVHKTISLAALFLIGLALRNLFKLK